MSKTISIKNFSELNGKFNVYVINPENEDTFFETNLNSKKKKIFDIYSLIKLNQKYEQLSIL